MSDPREEAIRWIERALRTEQPEFSDAQNREHAEALNAHAEESGIPVEQIVEAIHANGGLTLADAREEFGGS